MSTSRANLDVTQYVKVADSGVYLLLQSHRDTVRVVFSDIKPAKSNTTFHELGGNNEPLSIPYTETDVWVLAMTECSALTITTQPLPVIAPENPLNKTYNTDAWFRNKVVIDKSILSGMFTYNIPADLWYEMVNDVEQSTKVSATVEDGKMVLVSGAENEKRQLRSLRCARYEPNRGLLWSISVFFPLPAASAERSIGIFTRDTGVGFRLRSGVLYAFRRTTIQGVTTDIEEVITVPDDVDLSKGNVLDIQMQWRGVGSYAFYINLEQVHRMDLLGGLDELSIYNPALPVAFESINQGDASKVVCGCVDVSSEGGDARAGVYGSLATSTESGSIAIDAYNIPVLVLRNKSDYDSYVNTRDVTLLRLSGYADQRCVLRGWYARGDASITLNDQVWTDYRDGHLEYIEYDNPNVANPMTFDTSLARLAFSVRVDQDQTYQSDFTFDDKVNIPISPGGLLVITMHRETGGATNAGASLEFSENV